MNKAKFLLPVLTGAGYLLLAATASPLHGQGQRPAKRTSSPPATAKATPTAAPAPAPKENANVAPAPDADSDEPSPPTDEPDKSQDTQTDIDASQAASFSSKDRIAVFIGNVKVTDPRFQLVCDKLTVFLNKSASTSPDAAATPPPLANPPPAAGKGKGGEDSATPSGGSGIDHAIAEGHVIILQKKAPTKPGEEEKLSIGRGEIGTFDNKTGDMTLKGWPSLEQNGSSLIAKAEGTVMTIHRDSSLNTEGPCTTHLIQHGKGNGLDIPTGPETPTTARQAGGNPAGNARGGTNAPATQH